MIVGLEDWTQSSQNVCWEQKNLHFQFLLILFHSFNWIVGEWWVVGKQVCGKKKTWTCVGATSCNYETNRLDLKSCLWLQGWAAWWWRTCRVSRVYNSSDICSPSFASVYLHLRLCVSLFETRIHDCLHCRHIWISEFSLWVTDCMFISNHSATLTFTDPAVSVKVSSESLRGIIEMIKTLVSVWFQKLGRGTIMSNKTFKKT